MSRKSDAPVKDRASHELPKLVLCPVCGEMVDTNDPADLLRHIGPHVPPSKTRQ